LQDSPEENEKHRPDVGVARRSADGDGTDLLTRSHGN
jgi:hypothetical protein